MLSPPEMREQRNRVKATLIDPDEVRESTQSSELWLFYKFYETTPVTKKFMLVVVRVLNAEGFIVTAFFTDKIKKGEIVWKKSQ